MVDDRAPWGGSFQSLSAAGLVPFKDRCAYVKIPELALRDQPAVSAAEVWDSFSKDYTPVQDFFSCIQMVRPNRLHIWCVSARILEDVLNSGLSLRGHPLHIKPVVDRCWLTVTHLPYGLPKQAIEDFFAGFGEVKSIKYALFRKVHTGTIKVQMVLHKSVPTRIRVLGHAGLVYHPGQARTCFHCGVIGHESKRCPKKEPASTTTKNKRSPRADPPGSAKPPGDTSSQAAPPPSDTNNRKRGRSSTTTAPKPSDNPSQPQQTAAHSGQSPGSPPVPQLVKVIQDPPLDTATSNRPPGEAHLPADPPTKPAEATLTTPSAPPPHRHPIQDNPMEVTSDPPLDIDPSFSTEGPTEPPEVFHSPKGTFGPPASETIDVAVEQVSATPQEEEPRFEDPPLVRSVLKAMRKNSRRRPAPVPTCSDLACSRKPSKPAPVCGTGAKNKTYTGKVPSDPSLTVSSLF